MKKYVFYILAVAVVLIGGCTSKKNAPTADEKRADAATASPATATESKPGASATPMVQGTIPPQIPEILRRPLTREEIMRLPPETRDMILRAQGQPVPSPTKKK
ncbi:MAG: hypothetical protein KF868_19885 [Acidobacteria bacterium]|nr:hypothetical protein [Acidobacteriota bacterium]MCW5971537.1 hypothetical protein [Blastocatellales bacterium]